MLGPIMLAVIVGGIGFPVLHDLRRDLRRPARWSVHTKITLFGTALLLLARLRPPRCSSSGPIRATLGDRSAPAASCWARCSTR